ncbi:hypothetical protein GQ55_8G033000 [Panicum hallii var. hallii]|uniref:Uncharacterized protein n=1 Tax=Panicum hallii var. hallii TaxID=1504633 RepID=A0A2T7CK88_9POAL|nr:hypothetical protein GQ55_8G033000 [Panicum hallii var. hallii]PUZ43754.1 hypothetical protein GQ55_8G033000 [Panicum hallii var. hallii]
MYQPYCEFSCDTVPAHEPRHPLGDVDAAVHAARGKQRREDDPVRARLHPRHQPLGLLHLPGPPQHLHHARVVLQRGAGHPREHPPPLAHHPGPRARRQEHRHSPVVHLRLQPGEEAQRLRAPPVRRERAGQRGAGRERALRPGRSVEHGARGGEVPAGGVPVDEGRREEGGDTAAEHGGVEGGHEGQRRQGGRAAEELRVAPPQPHCWLDGGAGSRRTDGRTVALFAGHKCVELGPWAV